MDDTAGLLRPSLGSSDEGTTGEPSLNTVASEFILDIEEYIKKLADTLDREMTNRKLTQLNYFTIKELNLKIFSRCMEAEAKYISSNNKIKMLEEHIKYLENQTSLNDHTLNKINERIKTIVDTHKNYQARINAI